MSSARATIVGLLLTAVLGATAVEGATEHLPALLLRGAAAGACVAIWPSGPVCLRARDLVAPGVAALAMALGLVGATNVGPALQSAVSVALVIGLYLALLASRADYTSTALGLFAAVGAAHAAWAIGERLAGQWRGTGGFFNPNDLAAFLAPLVVLSLNETLRTAERRPFDRRRLGLALGLTVLLLGGVVASGSRSGLVAALAGAAIAAAAKLRRRPWALAGLGALACGSAALLYQRWTGQTDPFSYARLTHIWPRSIELALQHPTGVGLAGFGEAMRVFGIPFAGMVRYPRVATHAHNEVLNAFVEIGWLGLVATVLPALVVGLALWQQRSSNRSVAGHAGVLVALAIPALLSAALHVPPIAFFAAAWAACVVRADPSAGRRLTFTWRRSVVAVLAAGTVLVAVPGAVSVTAMERAAELRGAGKIEEALLVAELAEGAAPYSVGAAMLAESLRYLAGADPNDSVERLLGLADRFPNAPSPVTRAAWVLEQRAGHHDPGARGWAVIARLRREAIDRDPLDIDNHLQLAVAVEMSGDSHAAIEALSAALEVEPHCANAHAHMALLHLEQGETASAWEHAGRARRAHAVGIQQTGHRASVLYLHPRMEKMLREAGLER